MYYIAKIASLLLLAGCVVTTGSTPAPTSSATPPRLSPAVASSNFRAVVARVEPMAERECAARTRGVNCDFLIQVHRDTRLPPNAFQSLGPNGRPMITFTVALIAEVRNRDELAFVLGHESAHHIAQHIPKQQQSAVGGAILGGLLASVLGADASGVDTAQRVGATVGQRSYSKKHELEADSLGTIITYRAGYNPERGAEYFTRIPDPGNKFLGSHPANADRIATVRATMAQLR